MKAAHAAVLIDALSDVDASVRSGVLEGLNAQSGVKEVDAEIVRALPALTRALEDTSPVVRSGAARALGGVGPNAKEALPELEVASKDPDATVRVAPICNLEEWPEHRWTD